MADGRVPCGVAPSPRVLGLAPPPISGGALLSRAQTALIDYNKLWLPRANDALYICEAVHIHGHPAAVHEYEVRFSDQPEMGCPESLDEKLFRMPPETENFAVTRPKLLLVHCRRLARGRTCTSLSALYVRSAVLNVRLPTYLCARL